MSRLLKILLPVLLITGAIFLYLYKTEFWSDQNKALRELKRQEIPATASQVQSSTAEADQDTLKLLGTAGVDFNDPSGHLENGDSPLHTAAKKNDWDTVNTLLSFDADPNAKDSRGLPVTAVVLESGNNELTEQLLSEGADVDFSHSSGEPALIHYLRSKDIDKTLVLLRNGTNPDTVATNGENALYTALKTNQREALSTLLSAGANPDSLTPSGTAILPYLSKNLPNSGFEDSDKHAILSQLVSSGADLNSTDPSGWRPLQWLIHHKQTPIVEKILQKDQNVANTLWIAINNKDYATALTLLKLKADPNQVGPEGHTPLHQVVRDNQAQLVTALIDHGVPPEQLGSEGQTALVTAIALKKTDAALALLTHPNKPSPHSTLMIKPVTDEFRELFNKRGYFDWYCRKTPGLTPLMAAIMRDELAVAEQLIKNGADPVQGTENRYKVYPIQMAAENQNVKMQQLIIGAPYEDDQQVRNFVIDLSEQKVRYYRNGELVKTSRISSGRSGYRTKPGKYVITDKTKNKRSNIYNDSPMPYFQRFSCGAIGFHEGNTYSRYASHGCIRLPMSTAKYFWGETSLGDRVEIVP